MVDKICVVNFQVVFDGFNAGCNDKRNEAQVLSRCNWTARGYLMSAQAPKGVARRQKRV
jgi:hypothetical protein